MPDAPRLSPRSGPLDLFAGAAIPFRAGVLLLRTPRLRALSLLCAGVTLVIFTAWALVLWHWLPGWLGALWPQPEGVARWLWRSTVVVTGALAWVVGAATLPLLALAPLQDWLVDATEAAVGAPPAPPLGAIAGAGQAVAAVGRTAVRVLALLTGQAALMLLHAVVPAAAPLWTAAGVGWTALWVCAEYLDAPMARHRRPFRQVRRVLAGRTALALGFGLVLTLLLWVPLLNFFLVPLAVCAGTLLFRSLVSAGTLS
jgi:CysZ protein